MRKGFLQLLILLVAAAAPHCAHADATTEAQLRAALQQSTAQIAALEDQVANLQAAQAPDVATIEALRAQLQNVQKSGGGTASAAAETSAAKAKSDAALAALTGQLAKRNAALARSETAYQTASTAAAAAAAENSTLKAQLAALNTGLASCDTKNAELFAISNQILDAYGHKDDLFGAIADREPFIGFKRVQLQNIVQDDEDKLYANQIIPAGNGH
jgi:chromosome segregation ATPase